MYTIQRGKHLFPFNSKILPFSRFLSRQNTGSTKAGGIRAILYRITAQLNMYRAPQRSVIPRAKDTGLRNDKTGKEKIKGISGYENSSTLTLFYPYTTGFGGAGILP